MTREMEYMSRRTRARTIASPQFPGIDSLVAGEASHGGEQRLQHEVQINVDGGREADHLEVLRYLSTARTSFHIPESGMIPQLRFNPGTTHSRIREIKNSLPKFFHL